MSRKSAELKRVEADRDFWQSFIKNDEWRLLGWSNRYAATFARDPVGSLELTHSHLAMLGLLPEGISGEDAK